MKQLKKSIAACLALCLLWCAGCSRSAEQRQGFRVVTSFYPMYIMALNITQGVEGVQVDNMAGQQAGVRLENLSEPQAGCLHDYQLQNKDMKNLERASVFVINGAGMESFMEKVTDSLPSLEVVNAGEGIPLLVDESGEENPHLWVNVSYAARQTDNIAMGLMRADPAHAEQYRANADRYIEKLSALEQEMQRRLKNCQTRNIITFHEAFPYFAQEFDLNIVRVVNREPDSQPSARELAETIREIRGTDVTAVFVEPQYPDSAADIVARESGAAVYTLGPAVTGEDSPDAYLRAMEKNLAVLCEALGGEQE